MKRRLSGIALAATLAWGCGGGAVEIPTVELGGAGGARLMNGTARTPSEAYENAYAQLTRAHYNVRRNLDGRSQNQYGAREAMKQIVACLDAMRSCVAAGDQVKFDPYKTRYGAWLKELDDGTWGGSFLSDFDRSEREVKSKFNPAGIEVLAEFPRAAEKKPAPPKPPDTGFTPDLVEAPKKAPPAEAASPKPAEPAPNNEATLRALYKAWSASHNELVAAWQEKKACRPKYEEVVESLRLMKAQCAGDRAGKLQLYIDYYGGVDQKTQGFTALPEKTTAKDIIDELEVAARVIRKEFNPDNK